MISDAWLRRFVRFVSNKSHFIMGMGRERLPERGIPVAAPSFVRSGGEAQPVASDALHFFGLFAGLVKKIVTFVANINSRQYENRR